MAAPQEEFVIYTDMVGDLFHCGHVNFLRQCREVATPEEAAGKKVVLIVGIHSDELVDSYKRKPLLTMQERMDSAAGCKYVDRVLGNAPMGINQEYLDLHQIDRVAGGEGDGFLSSNEADEDEEAAKALATKMVAMSDEERTPYLAALSEEERAKTLACWHDRQYDLIVTLGIFRGIPYTPGISTTDIIGRIIERHAEGALQKQ